MGQQRDQLVPERQHHPVLRTDQLGPRFTHHHGRRGIPQAGDRPGRRQQPSRHLYIQRNADRLCARPISFSDTQVSFGTPGPEVRGRVADWRDGFFVLDKWQVSRKLTLNYGIRYELPTVPYTINGNASYLNRRSDGPDRRPSPEPDSSPRITRTGRRAWASPTASRIRRCSAAAVASTTTPTRPTATLSSTRIRHGALSTSATGLPDSRRSACRIRLPYRPPVPFRGSSSGALIVTPPWNQPTGRMNQWSASLERQLWGGGGLELQYLGSHSYHLDRSFYNNTPLARTGRGQLSPAQQGVRPHPHHRQ